MKVTMAVWLTGFLLLAQRAAAGPMLPVEDGPDNSSNPYAVISDRNVFRLNPIPPVAGPEPPKVELPVVKLTGFFRIGHTTNALFCALPKDKKEAPSYYNMREGEKRDFLEVVKIHFDKGEVEVLNSGTPVTLNLKDDSLVAKQETAPGKPGSNPALEKAIRGRFQPPGGPREGSPDAGASPFAFPVRPRRTPAAPP
jgi:hypothetical protein